MEKEKNLKKNTIYEGPNCSKIKHILSGSNFKKLRTVQALPIFNGSYKKKRVFDKVILFQIKNTWSVYLNGRYCLTFELKAGISAPKLRKIHSK